MKTIPCAYQEECQHPACNCGVRIEPFKKDYFWKLDVLKRNGIIEMGLNVKPGQKVVGLFWDGDLMNGTDSEKEDAEKYILEGKEYTVKQIEIGGWHSTVVLEEFPKKHFNSVHFGIKTSLI